MEPCLQGTVAKSIFCWKDRDNCKGLEQSDGDWKAAKSCTEPGATEPQRDGDAKLKALRFYEKERAKFFFLQLQSW